MSDKLESPFVYFGGKKRVAGFIWSKFGNPYYYLEPFCGSAAVLLARNWKGNGVEILNDYNCFLCNFWRSVKYKPDETLFYADYPISHADLTVRHQFLVDNENALRESIMSNDEYCNAKLAGYWVWCVNCWIGSGLGTVTKTGKVSDQIPHTIHRNGIFARKNSDLKKVFDNLTCRLKSVILLCGDWKRGLKTKSILNSDCAVFLDPPYCRKISGSKKTYLNENEGLSKEVENWCIENENVCKIVVAGYDGEHTVLENRGWGVHSWSTCGGFKNQNKTKNNDNRLKERLWYNNLCNKTPLLGDM